MGNKVASICKCCKRDGADSEPPYERRTSTVTITCTGGPYCLCEKCLKDYHPGIHNYGMRHDESSLGVVPVKHILHIDQSADDHPDDVIRSRAHTIQEYEEIMGGGESGRRAETRREIVLGEEADSRHVETMKEEESRRVETTGRGESRQVETRREITFTGESRRVETRPETTGRGESRRRRDGATIVKVTEKKWSS